jgi:hypothetical protein
MKVFLSITRGIWYQGSLGPRRFWHGTLKNRG